MCGRYASSRPAQDLAETFGIRAENTDSSLPADYNVAPTKPVYAVLARSPRDAPQGEPVRRLAVLVWGLVPSWANDRQIGNRLINARVETVADKPAFRRAFAARRCLLPADGYYEWYAPSEPGRAKQPFFIHPGDGGVLAMAGLYEIWRDPSIDGAEPGGWVWTCTVLTTTATDDLGHIHDRSPLLVPDQHWSAWLDPAVDGRAVVGALEPATPGRLVAHPVSTAVNNVRNNGPDLVVALPAEGAASAGSDA
ncbi:MAG TPA: SOS response-associated peptidase [Mycobacteriales bacterium]|nr:SOS response-associated peptidase [Mycobacteriales bacterium]